MTEIELKPLGGKILTKPFLVCAFFGVVAVVLLMKRFIYGIGSVTNLSDGYPWGIWIAYDVVVGTGLACGGYAMALLVYIANKGQYHPLVRSATLASMFGYTLAGVSLFSDIGRYWQAYNLVLPWFAQRNSVMFELALCVGTYIIMLWIEFMPAFLERFNRVRLLKLMNSVVFIFIGIGALLPTMHQSSLGILMFIVADTKMSPLWHTGFNLLLFLSSSIMMGFSMVILESIASAIAFNREIETQLLSKIAAYIPPILTAYLAVRFWDLVGREKLYLVFAGGLKGNMCLLENVLYIIPQIVLMSPANRAKPRLLFLSAVSLLLAGAIFRFNVYLVGFDPGPGWHYFPSLPELLITVGLIAIEIMGYLYFVKKLPVLPARQE